MLTISGIPVEVCRKNIKNMHLYVKPPDGRVVVSAPLFMSNRTIEQFVQSKTAWIEKQRTKVQNRQRQTELEYKTGEALLVWGKPYYLRVEQGSRNALVLFDSTDADAPTPFNTAAADAPTPSSTTASNTRTLFSNTAAGTPTPSNSTAVAVLTLRGESTTEQRKKLVREWYREQLKKETAALLPKWEAITGLKATSWQTKYMTSRWGTCNTKTGKIWLNVQLAQKSPACLEYVIVHELVHLVERGHGQRFKALMDTYLPTWRETRAALNSSSQ